MFASYIVNSLLRSATHLALFADLREQDPINYDYINENQDSRDNDTWKIVARTCVIYKTNNFTKICLSVEIWFGGCKLDLSNGHI